MEPGMEIITADGRLIGHVGPPAVDGLLRLARSPNSIPLTWVTRVEREVLLRKTYRQIVERWGAEPGPRVIEGGKRTA